jgi:hypothetical protein
MVCTHYGCRCLRAEQLAKIAERTGDGRYLVEAIAVHHQSVPCWLEREPAPTPPTREVRRER